MRKTDARSFNDDTKQHIRGQIIHLRKECKKNRDIAIFFGISEQYASTIWQKYKKRGKNAVVLGLRGRRHGEKRTLNKDQEKEIKKPHY